jgi:hypothetical protein
MMMDFEEISSVEHSPFQENHLMVDEDLIRQESSEQKYEIDSPDLMARANLTTVNALDLIQIDIHSNGYVTAVIGSCILGKLLWMGESDSKQQEITEAAVLKYLCTSNMQTLKILPVSSTNDFSTSLPFEVTTKYSLLFQNVPDGSLGISVEFVSLPVKGFCSWGLRIHSIAEDTVNNLCFRLGDIIISVNGTCLVEMEKKSAVILLSTSHKRRLVLLRELPTLLSCDHAAQTMAAETGELDAKKILSSDAGFSSSSKNLDEPQNSVGKEDFHSKNWKSIRSNFMCKTFYYQRKIRRYDENNYEYLPKYHYVSDLKTAVTFGNHSYKEFVIKSVESKINIENY